MITLFLILLIIVAGLVSAYTMNFQQSTLTLGKELAADNPLLPTGFQNAITPRGQTARNIIYPILILAVLVYGLVFYKWYIAVGVIVLTVIIVIPVLKIILPKPGTDFYKHKIKKDLLKRQAKYKRAGDRNREIAINEILKRFI